MNRTLKVFIACALGAGIGTMIALQIGGYLWWIGMLAGALVGYLTIEFKAVLIAAVTAWKKVSAYAFEPDEEKYKENIKQSLWLALLLWNFLAIMYLQLGLMFPLLKLYFPLAYSHQLISCASILPLLVSNCWLAGKLAASDEAKEKKYTILFCNPIFLLTLGPVAFLYLIAKFLKVIVFPFCKTLFLLIHSEIRLLCFFDAGIGAGIGYFYHYALIGALSGGILGAINYEIVSKRLLKLVPTKS
jgi:hypothetical protein